MKNKTKLIDDGKIIDELLPLLLMTAFYHNPSGVTAGDAHKEIRRVLASEASDLAGRPIDYQARPSLLYPLMKRMTEKKLVKRDEINNIYIVSPAQKTMLQAELKRTKDLIKRLSALFDKL